MVFKIYQSREKLFIYLSPNIYEFLSSSNFEVISNKRKLRNYDILYWFPNHVYCTSWSLICCLSIQNKINLHLYGVISQNGPSNQ